MFAKTSPSRNINDLILQTELKHPLFDSEQHFLESQSLLHFLFHLKERRIGITSGPVHGSQSWKVPLLMSPLTLGFFFFFALTSLCLQRQSAQDRVEASRTQPHTRLISEAPCDLKVTDESQMKLPMAPTVLPTSTDKYESLCVLGLSRARCLLYMAFLLANKMVLQMQMWAKKSQMWRSCPKNVGSSVNVLSQQTHLSDGIRL